LRALKLARQTLQIEADAILAMKDRLSDQHRSRAGRRRFIAAMQWSRGGLRHRQVRPYRSQDRRHFRLYRHPGAVHAPGRSSPRRPRHGNPERRLHCHFEFRRNRRADGHRAHHQTHGCDADRHDRQRQLQSGATGRGPPQCRCAQEACTLNLAPTASTTATLAMGDALAVSLLDARGFREEDFARSHPGGALGRRLLTHVRDVMRSGDAIPAVTPDVSLSAALMEITRKGMAMTAVVDQDFKPIGVFTDGDLRRLLERGEDFRGFSIADVMHANPRTVHPDQLAVDAVQLMEEFRINQVLVADSGGVLVGALHIHDLTRAKVI